MANAAIYCRLSKDDMMVGDSKSIQHQKMMLTDYCKTNNIDIYDVYVDDGISGTVFERPDFQRMLKDAETGVIDTIVVKDISRFSRDDIVIKQYLQDIFYRWHIHFIGLDGTDNLNNNFLDWSSMQGFLVDWYIRDCSKKVRAVLSAKAKRGEYCKSAPYGYKKDPVNKGHLIIDEPAAEVVRRIFKEYTDGIALSAIANKLNQEGIPNPSHYKCNNYPNYKSRYSISKWTDNSIRSILRKEVYIGNTVLGQYAKQSYRTKKYEAVPREDWIRTEGTHEPIITMDIWRKVTARMANKHRASPITNHLKPLAGKVFCAQCGLAMIVRNYADLTSYYKCPNSKNGSQLCTNYKCHRMPDVHSIVLDEINKSIQQYINPESISISVSNVDRYTKQLTNIETDIDKTQGRLDRLYEDLADELITKEQYTRLKDKYTAQLQTLAAQREQVQAQIEQLQDTDHIRTLIEQYATGNITELTVNLVNDLVDTVRLGTINNGTVVAVDMIV